MFLCGPSISMKQRARAGAGTGRSIAQIQQRDYASELRAAGASLVHGFAVAFDGKHVRVARA
jgi:hypothetical protein